MWRKPPNQRSASAVNTPKRHWIMADISQFRPKTSTEPGPSPSWRNNSRRLEFLVMVRNPLRPCCPVCACSRWLGVERRTNMVEFRAWPPSGHFSRTLLRIPSIGAGGSVFGHCLCRACHWLITACARLIQLKRPKDRRELILEMYKYLVSCSLIAFEASSALTVPFSHLRFLFHHG
jgi:hypothetical protein